MEKKDILIIDDEKDLLDIMKSILESAGFDVRVAGDGEEGLKKVQQKKPHLILLDMNMPKMGGIEFYHAIYDTETERPKHPVLILTGRANLEELFHDLNVDGFMTKPFDIDTLLKEVNLILTQHYAEADKKSEAEKQKEEVPLTEFRKPKIVLIEKDGEILANMVDTFLNEGYMVVPANSALRGIDLARSESPDLILINLNLPDLPGDLLVFKLKQMSRTSRVPLLLYTSDDHRLNPVTMNKMCKKMGVKGIVGTSDPQILVKGCASLLKQAA